MPLFVSVAVPVPDDRDIVPVTGVWHNFLGSLDISPIVTRVVIPRSVVCGETSVLVRLYEGRAVGRTASRMGIPDAEYGESIVGWVKSSERKPSSDSANAGYGWHAALRSLSLS